MIRIHRRISKAVTVLALSALVLTGCTSEASNIGSAKEKDGKTDVVDTGFTLSTVGSYDSADTAVVLSTDSRNKAVTFINMDTGKQYTLYYDGTTYVQNKHDGPMTISQIEAGDVVDVTFLKGKKRLASIKLSPEAWVYDEVYNYDLAGANRTASIGSQTYSLPEGVVVLSEGRRVDKAEVVSQDIVTISGIDHEIYSVSVDKGHGYLRLKNDQALLGGWIEVGNKVIRQITEDMLLVVPEGSYQVALSNKNVGCVKDVTVERDKEVVLDVGDLEVAEDAVGKILFTVTPETAKVSVDGKPVDISKVVELPYGIHQVQAQASGYDTLTRHIQVGSEYAAISFKLEESRQADSGNNSVSDNSASRIPWQDTLDSVKPKEKETATAGEDTYSSVSQNALGTSSSYKVYIDSPKNVEVYLDDNYIGISPVRFNKTAGRHEITLKKNGYKTKSYSIYLENTKQDETLSFSALEKEGSADSNKKIPEKVVKAVSGLAGCKLIYGTDVAVAGDLATLQESGIEKVKTAVKNAVTDKVGDTETTKYTFVVTANLSSVTPPKDEDGKGTVSVTISGDGYERQVVSCDVVIEKKVEETPTPDPEKKYTVTVTPDKTEVEKGGTVTVTAVVQENEQPVENAEVSWAVSGNMDAETKIESGVLSVGAGETAEKLTVTATYAEVSGSVEIAVKQETGNVSGGNNSGIGDNTGTGGNTGNGDNAGTGGNTGSSDNPGTGGETGSGDNTTGAGGGTESGDNPGAGGETGSGDNPGIDSNTGTNGNTAADDKTDSLTTETVTINQNAHPIRKFFSSLFK